jgi:hypothetical protein
MIEKAVTVTVDRTMGTYHPEYPDLYYPINYGYIKGIIAPDGEEQDAYIIGISEPVDYCEICFFASISLSLYQTLFLLPFLLFLWRQLLLSWLSDKDCLKQSVMSLLFRQRPFDWKVFHDFYHYIIIRKTDNNNHKNTI